MAYPSNRPLNERPLCASTASIATTPVAASVVAAGAGYIQRAVAAAGGTTSGVITVAVSINGGSDVLSGALQIPAGSGARNGAVAELTQMGIGNTFVNEGDFISFTPSGGTGSNIPGAFSLVLRTLA